jgi:NAD(P)-dependent dehydrogenase (short-subunit alcohol dehydrogenase family)
MIDLAGKTAIIIGQSRGIGAAAAIFAKADIRGLTLNYNRDRDATSNNYLG